MLTRMSLVKLLTMVALGMAGCTESKPPGGTTTGTDAAAAPDAAYLLTEKPAAAQGVAEVRKSSQGEEEVVIEGRIGGSEQPFVEGLAAFTIVDYAIPHCSADEGCPTPWDYCCQTDKLRDNSALVKIVGPDGMPLSKDARGLLGVKELTKVVVRGQAKRDEQGNLTVLAEKVHVVSE